MYEQSELYFICLKKKGCKVMAKTESITIKVPIGMSKYLNQMNPETELIRNALLLYPHILNQSGSRDFGNQKI